MVKTTPSYQVASWALDLIDGAFKQLGLPRGGELEEVVYTAIVIILAWSIGWLIKVSLIFILSKIPKFRESISISAQHGQKVLIVSSHIIPPMVFLALIPFAFNTDSDLLKILEKITFLYFIVASTRAINAILEFFWHRYDERDNVKNHPLKGILQISQGIVWLFALIVVVSMVLDKSPVALLTGLGAFAAILMLVFKDSILGVVAGVQLSQNDMLRVGDWIVVPGTLANGTVFDVSLTVVKVRNWDNTIVMVPPYTLVSTSFQNWRGMGESGVRRISRDFLIDMDSVQFATPEMLEDFKQIPYMNDYITKKQQLEKEGKDVNTANPEGLVNGTIDTNLGMFRAYLVMYLKNNKNISQVAANTLMVRTLEPTPSGIPLQIYCFTNTTNWVSYESIQSEIFEHFGAMVTRFGLYIFENPSGRDTVNQGFLEGGIHPNQVMGLPYQSIYNWVPGENKYPNPTAFTNWDKPLPRNDTYKTYPFEEKSNDDTSAPTSPTPTPTSVPNDTLKN